MAILKNKQTYYYKILFRNFISNKKLSKVNIFFMNFNKLHNYI
jgi:hypothetical protein